MFYREDACRPFDRSTNPVMGSAISTALHAAQFQRSAQACLQPSVSDFKCEDQLPLSPVAHLTKRQQQVLRCLFQGWPNKLIARHLSISENTLKTHLCAIYDALKVTSRAQAIIAAGKLSLDAGSNDLPGRAIAYSVRERGTDLRKS